MAGLGLLANLIAAWWASGTAMLLRTTEAGALIQLPVFVILFLAPVFVPLHLLTGWLTGRLTGWIHGVASVNPATPILEAGRGLLAGAPVDIALCFGLLGAGLARAGIWARLGLASAGEAG